MEDSGDHVGFDHHGLQGLIAGLKLDTAIKRLSYGVMMDAIRILQHTEGKTSAARSLVKNTTAWIASEKDDEWSFLWVCDVLQLEASAVRKALLEKLPGKRLRGIAPMD